MHDISVKTQVQETASAHHIQLHIFIGELTLWWMNSVSLDPGCFIFISLWADGDGSWKQKMEQLLGWILHCSGALQSSAGCGFTSGGLPCSTNEPRSQGASDNPPSRLDRNKTSSVFPLDLTPAVGYKWTWLFLSYICLHFGKLAPLKACRIICWYFVLVMYLCLYRQRSLNYFDVDLKTQWFWGKFWMCGSFYGCKCPSHVTQSLCLIVGKLLL